MSIQGCTDLISIVCHTLKDSSLQGLDTGQIFELTTNFPPVDVAESFGQKPKARKKEDETADQLSAINQMFFLLQKKKKAVRCWP